MMRRIYEDDLYLGQPVHFPIWDCNGLLLLGRGEIVRSEVQLQRLLREGYLIESELERPHSQARSTSDFMPTGDRVNVFQEVRALIPQLELIHRVLLFRHGHPMRDSILAVATKLQTLFDTDPDATLASMQLDVFDDAFASKQLHAGLICKLLARDHGMSDQNVLLITAAALTYDVALGPLQTELNRHPAPLSPADKQQIRSHPAEGAALLRAAGIDDPLWLDAVLHHHEKLDGSGYPDGLSGDAITLAGRILALADAYCSMIRPRTYRAPLHANEAIRTLFKQGGHARDAELCARLVKGLGIFPPGTFVRLHNREIAIVVRHGEHAAHPMLCAVVDPYGNLLPQPVPRDSYAHETMIVEAVPLGAYQAALQFAPKLWH